MRGHTFFSSVLHRAQLSALSVFALIMFNLVPLTSTAQVDTLWFENWESPNWTNDWHVDAGTWEVGIPTSGPNAAYGGQNCAATVLAGNYTDGVNSTLIRHTLFVVPSADQNPRLRFWYWFQFNAGDYVQPVIRVVGGQWSALMYYSYYGSYAWSRACLDLSSWADSTVQIGFYFHSHQVDYWNPDVEVGLYLDEVCVETGPTTLRSPENWEVGLGDWGVDRGTWEVGVPSSGPAEGHMSPHCAATRLAGDYYEWCDTRLVSPPFIVPSPNLNPALRFWHWLSFNAGDCGHVQILDYDADTLQWSDIEDRGYWGTSSGVWTNDYYDLAAFENHRVRIGFRFQSQQIDYWNWDCSSGWYVDDIEIQGYGLATEPGSEVGRVTCYGLDQNYPNPFNPSTTIAYDLPKAGHISLRVFDLLGREVAVLKDGFVEAGTHRVTFDGSGLASGIYFARLDAGAFSQTKKLMLLK